MFSSKINGKTYSSHRSLSMHIVSNSMTVLEYYTKYEGLIIPKCKYCESDAKYISRIRKFRHTCGAKECITKGVQERSRTESARENQRKNRFKFLSDPANFTKTAWGKTVKNIMTYGEERLHNIMTSAGIYETFDVVSQYPVYPYFIDFAFVNEKVALEFDGQCHFKYEKRIDHDIKRDARLEELGWRTYRVSYLEIDTFQIEDLLKFIGSPKEKQTMARTLIIRPPKIKVPKVKGVCQFSPETLAKFKKRNDVQYELAKLVESSTIDFAKNGWVKEVAKIINRTPQKVNGWMKRFMPEFYETVCFKRKPKAILNK